MIRIREIKVTRVLSKSGIYDVDYSINPYLGCSHGCLYCYAKYITRYREVSNNWGSVVYVKVNAPRVLKKEIKRVNKGSVLLSSITDPYQKPVEERYELTRRILEVLSKSSLRVIIMTKSNLILRDFDLIMKLKSVEVGITIITLDEQLRRIIEPKASSVEERIQVLKELSGKVMTFIFAGPFIPYLSDYTIEDLLRLAREIKVNRVIVDSLNLKGNVLNDLMKVLKETKFDYLKTFSILRHPLRYSKYYTQLKRKLKRLSKRYDIPIDFAY